MSFFPPPGMFMAATNLQLIPEYWRSILGYSARARTFLALVVIESNAIVHLVSTMLRKSPIGFSSEYKPPCSNNCRTSSFVTYMHVRRCYWLFQSKKTPIGYVIICKIALRVLEWAA